MLTATADGTTLTLLGETADSGSTKARVVQIGASITLRDNDALATLLPIDGDTSGVQNIDARGVSGGGVNLFGSFDGRSILKGSGQDDIITAFGTGDDVLSGGRGDDDLTANAGDDRLIGGRGNDRMNGGLGDDALVLRGPRSEYSIDIVNGQYVVSHLGGLGFDGTDTFVNVETLIFSDQSVAINVPVPTQLTAIVTADTLVLSGTALDTGARQVDVDQIGAALTIEDNDDLGLLVPISGDMAAVENIDARGVLGGSVNIFSSFDGRSVLTGSRQDDFIFAFGSGDDVLRGGRGNDRLEGNAGDDTFVGGRGDDQIDGGQDNDILILRDVRDAYEVRIVGGQYEISHLGGTGFDGIDLFVNIETIRFSDEDVAVSPATASNLFAHVAGNTLIVTGEAASAGTQRASITQIGSDITVADNDSLGVLVEISGNPSAVQNIDASSVGQAGVLIFSSFDGASTLRGSRQADYIFANQDGDDMLIGGAGNDTLRAENGDDRIRAGKGDDEVDGGDGFDGLLLRGARADYSIEQIGLEYRITDVSASGFDGTDVFIRIEQLQFSDQNVLVDDLVFA